MKKVILSVLLLLSAFAIRAQDMYQESAMRTGCPEWILRGIAMTESGCNSFAVGDDGISLGMFQLNEKYHEERARKYGEYDAYNPEQAVLIAGYIMEHNLSVFTDYRDAIAAYRQGVSGVKKHGRTDWYVNRVIKYGKENNGMSKSISFSVSNEQYENMQKRVEKQGFQHVSALSKHIVITDMNTGTFDGKEIHIILQNYDTVENYVKEKSFGTIESFFTFAAEQYMRRFPLTCAKKQQSDSLTDNNKNS